ncbi:unnamed protein product, partial [marine sediment metagenome]
DHFDDDTFFGPRIFVPQYWFEYTLAGMELHHQPDGVPLIEK